MEENNNEVKTKETTSGEGNVINNAPQGSYITGIIGAVIGGAIASLPWVLVYVYGNMIVAILAVLIALGAFYGYKLVKGKMGKGLPAIMQDALVSIAFTIVGIAGTIKSMKMQIKSGATDIKFSEQPLTEIRKRASRRNKKSI